MSSLATSLNVLQDAVRNLNRRGAHRELRRIQELDDANPDVDVMKGNITLCRCVALIATTGDVDLIHHALLVLLRLRVIPEGISSVEKSMTVHPFNVIRCLVRVMQVAKVLVECQMPTRDLCVLLMDVAWAIERCELEWDSGESIDVERRETLVKGVFSDLLKLYVLQRDVRAWCTYADVIDILDACSCGITSLMLLFSNTV